MGSGIDKRASLCRTCQMMHLVVAINLVNTLTDRHSRFV